MHLHEEVLEQLFHPCEGRRGLLELLGYEAGETLCVVRLRGLLALAIDASGAIQLERLLDKLALANAPTPLHKRHVLARALGRLPEVPQFPLPAHKTHGVSPLLRLLWLSFI